MLKIQAPKAIYKKMFLSREKHCLNRNFLSLNKTTAGKKRLIYFPSSHSLKAGERSALTIVSCEAGGLSRTFTLDFE